MSSVTYLEFLLTHHSVYKTASRFWHLLIKIYGCLTRPDCFVNAVAVRETHDWTLSFHHLSSRSTAPAPSPSPKGKSPSPFPAHLGADHTQHMVMNMQLWSGEKKVWFYNVNFQVNRQSYGWFHIIKYRGRQKQKRMRLYICILYYKCWGC